MRYQVFGIDWGAEEKPFSFPFNTGSAVFGGVHLAQEVLGKHLRDSCAEWLVCELDEEDNTMESVLNEFNYTIVGVDREGYPEEPILYVTCRPYRGENTELVIYQLGK